MCLLDAALRQAFINIDIIQNGIVSMVLTVLNITLKVISICSMLKKRGNIVTRRYLNLVLGLI